jgi:D-alanine-D-alanine ligase
MDKLATAGLAAMCGVPTIDTVLIPPDDRAIDLPPTPWVVKPRFGGSSLGVEGGVEDLDTARALGQRGVGRSGMLVQPMLSGWSDINVSVRTHPTLQVSEPERPLRDDDAIYGYQDKYLSGGAGMESAPRELPARLPGDVGERIAEYARRLVPALGLSGAPRIDFLWDGADQVVLCEINSIPGAWGAYLWQASGVAREQLFEDLIGEAMSGPTFEPQWASQTDGRALRTAGSIASKLT